MANEKLNRHKSPGTNQIPEKFIKAGGRTIHSKIQKLTNSIWNKDKLPQQWKEITTVPIYNKNDKTGCCNYSGISLLSTTKHILPNILQSRLTSHADRIIGDNECGF
jgi:hypothetical protein